MCIYCHSIDCMYGFKGKSIKPLTYIKILTTLLELHIYRNTLYSLQLQTYCDLLKFSYFDFFGATLCENIYFCIQYCTWYNVLQISIFHNIVQC